MDRRIKITVLRAEMYPDLAEEFAVPDLGPCPWHHKGQVFHTAGEMPEGMCGYAWQTLAPFVGQLMRGELLQPSGTWLRDDKVGVFACLDGVRPVIFKLETVED